MKRYFRHSIAGIALMMTPLNALGDEVSWGIASTSSVMAHKGAAASDSHAKRETILDEVLAWTVSRTDYKAPKAPLEIDFQPTNFFIDQACSKHEPCSAKGIYRDGGNQITLHVDYRDLTRIEARAMLVHEFAHLLQDRSGQWTGDGCRSWVAREQEAYLLQRRYLIAKGGFPPYALRLPSISEAACEARSRVDDMADQSAVSPKATRHLELR